MRFLSVSSCLVALMMGCSSSSGDAGDGHLTLVPDADSDAQTRPSTPDATTVHPPDATVTSIPDAGNGADVTSMLPDAGTSYPVATGETIVTLASGTGTLTGFAIDSTYAYWVDGNVWKVPLGGGAALNLLGMDAGYGPGPMAIDPTAVYWGESVGDSYEVSKAGGTAMFVFDNDVEQDHFAIAAGSVYYDAFFGGGGSNIESFPLIPDAGIQATAVVDMGVGPFAVDDKYLYFWSTGDLWFTSFDGARSGVVVPGALSDATDGSNNPWIAVDATYVYWVDDAIGVVMKAPKTGPDAGAPVTLALNCNQPFALAVDGTNVYWTELENVMKVPIGGGTPTILVQGMSDQAAFIAVDGTSVYWTPGEADTIMKVAPK